jgi:hypothetical protein
MRKPKDDQIVGKDPWDIEIEFLINQRGFDPDQAQTLTVLRSMYWGNLRPLAAAIWKANDSATTTITLEKGLLNYLARMIDEGRVTAKPHGRGKPMQLHKSARDILAALLYEYFVSEGSSSESAFQEVAKTLSMSEPNVRRAVTSLRKSNAQ